jgi:hypothetical protein
LYKRREIVKGYFFYAVSLLLLAALLFAVFIRRADYFIFLLLGFIPIEVFLAPNQVTITETDISISKMHLLGIIKFATVIPFARIISVHLMNFESGYNIDGYGDFIIASIPFIPDGSNAPAVNLYQIIHTTGLGKTKQFKLKLHPNEFNIFQEKLAQSIQKEDNLEKSLVLRNS